jgi:hypothetical protein
MDSIFLKNVFLGITKSCIPNVKIQFKKNNRI